MNVFDSSALLCFLLGENGSELIERELVRGGVCGTANWSEVAQKVWGGGGDGDLARGLLLSYPLMVEPVEPVDAGDAE